MNILIITLIIVFVWDFLGAPVQMLASIYSVIFNKEIEPYRIKLPKPFSCSLCMSFWVTLLVQLITLPFTFTGVLLMVAMSLLCAWSTRPILQIINIIDKLVSKILTYIERHIDEL